MDFDFSTDLINKSQIWFRQAAGLSSFNPTGSTLPSLPTVEASISTVDPSPAYLRCKFCQGKLVRGLQSLICIYCGEFQKKDLPPDPISFNSTIGYNWLLQSLYFNGSERVGSLSEGFEMTGGAQSPAEDEATLSEFLDLKILWRDVERKKHENNFKITNSGHNSSLNLNNKDFDDFFTESKRVTLSSDIPEEQQPIASKNDQNKAFEGQENITSVSSAIDASDEASSDWNAEFQFSDNTKSENENLESVEPDLSGHLDAVFGQMESFSNKKMNDDSDMFQDDDLFANVGSETFKQDEQLDSDVKSNDEFSGQPKDLNSESVDADWFSDVNDPINIKKDDNIFDIKEQIDSDIGNIKFINKQIDSDATVQSKDGLSGNPNDLNSEDEDADWFSDSNWQKNTVNNTVTVKKDDNLFDIKPLNDSNPTTDWFTANNIKKDDILFDIKPLNDSDLDISNKQHSDTTTNWFQDNQWAIGASSSTTNTNMVANKDDDVFDDWNDFTSSTADQDSFQDSWKQNSNEKDKILEVNLYPSAVDSQKVDLGDFFESDLFSGSSSNTKQNDNLAEFDIFSEVSTLSRNPTAEGGNIGNESKNDENTLEASTSTKSDVEMLLSQMHDLSFMLSSELSIPSKSNESR